MIGKRRGAAIGFAALLALGGVGACHIMGAGGMGHTLQRHIGAGVVHHGEHRGQPLPLGPDQLCLGPVEGQLAGGRGVEAHLFLDPGHGNRVARAICPRAGAQEQRQPLHPVVRGAGKDEVQDPRAHVLIAARDEDLLAADLPMVACPRGPAANSGKVRASAGFRQAHGGQRLARCKARDMARLLVFRAEAGQHAHRAGHEPRDHLQGMVRAGKDLGRDRQHERPHALPAMVLGRGEAGPALFGISAVDPGEAIGHPHAAIFQPAALPVARFIEGRDFPFRESREMGPDLARHVGIPVGGAVRAGHMGQGKEDVVQGGCEGFHRAHSTAKRCISTPDAPRAPRPTRIS